MAKWITNQHELLALADEINEILLYNNYIPFSFIIESDYVIVNNRAVEVNTISLQGEYYDTETYLWKAAFPFNRNDIIGFVLRKTNEVRDKINKDITKLEKLSNG